MLAGVAPRDFAALGGPEQLSLSLDRLETISTDFPPGLPLDLAMTRLDALYLRALYRRPLPPLDGQLLQAYLDSLGGGSALLATWMMSEQGALLGLLPPVSLSERYPLAASHWVLHLYFLTHVVMLRSRFFAQRLETSEFQEEVVQLQRGVEPTIAAGCWDLLGEIELCLAFLGSSCPKARRALQQAQRPDGSWREPGQSFREMAHTTAACSLALAGEDPGPDHGRPSLPKPDGP